MPREPLRLTSSVLATYRPGGLVAVAVGALASIPRRRPSGYAARARAQVASAPSRGPLPPTAPATAIITVRGVLEQRADEWGCGETCGYDTIEADIRAACEDPGIGQIIIDTDSPGGDVPGLEQAIASIQGIIARSGKPVLGWVNERAASGAVWLLSGICHGIYLPPSGRMGSVGACVVYMTEARALADAGVDVYVGRDPAGKMKPNDVELLDDIGKGRIDRLAAEGAARFFAAVETFRGIDEATARSWNGDTFTGEACVEAGLADGVMSFEDVVALAEVWPRAEAA